MHPTHRPYPGHRFAHVYALLALVALLIGSILPVPKAHAVGALVVKSLLDTDDANQHSCTLREALQGIGLARQNPAVTSYHECSNIASDINTITFQVAGTISVQSSLPDVANNVSITGPIIIDGSNNVNAPIFRVSLDSGILNLAGITLTKGAPAILVLNGGVVNIAGSSFVANVNDGDGGAINSNGKLNIAGTNFTGNCSNGSNGGGAIYHRGADALAIGGSVFNGNIAKRSAGAIYAGGPGIIADTAFNGNIAQSNDPNNNGTDGDAADDYYSQGAGAVYNANDGSNGRKMTIVRSVFNGNLAIPKGNGGALYNASGAVVEVRDSAFNANVAGSLSNDRMGGAIMNLAQTFSLQNTTLIGNLVTGDGGALVNDRKSVVTISNVTATGNAASNRGGGVFNLNSQQGSDIRPTVTILNSTIALNVAPGGGGNIYSQAPSSSYDKVTILGNTIISGSDTGGMGGNCAAGPLVSLGHNLDSGTSCGLAQPGDLNNANADLGPPGFSGGAITTLLTMKLNASSQALDAGDAAICAAAPVSGEDERGVARGGDGNGDGVGGCDIGAYEGETLKAGFGSSPVQPGPIDLGSVVFGSTGTATFSVFSTGNKALELSSPVLSGAYATEFALNTAFPISTSGNTSISVSCTPAGATPGVRTATLSFSTNDPDHANVGFSLLCSATAAPQPGYGSSPAPGGTIDFGDVTLGAVINRKLTVLETGNATLAVNTAVLGGANPAEFSFGAGVNLSLSDGHAPVDIDLSCTPTGLGARSATLTLASNDPTRPSVSYTLVCNGKPAPAPVLETVGTRYTGGIPTLNGPYGIASSPDGKHVYVAGNLSSFGQYGGVMYSFARDTNTGALSLFQTFTDTDNALEGAIRVLVSPDGNYVYVSASGGPNSSGSVVSYSRSSNGSLTKIDEVTNTEGYGCIIQCAGTIQMNEAYGMALSPDGTFLYVSANNSNSITVLRRSADGGLDTYGPSIIVRGANHVQTVTHAGLVGPYDIVISPDGKYLYAASYSANPDTIMVFARNAQNGQLTYASTISQNEVPSLNGVFRLAISPDGNTLYSASFDSNNISAFQRNSSTGTLSFLGSASNNAQQADGQTISGLNEASSVKVSPDGRYVFASGFGSAALVIFERNQSSGALDFVQAISRQANGLPALAGARDITIAPDMRSVHVTGYNDDSVVTLRFANPQPVLSSLAPASATAGAGDLLLTVNGEGFVAGAILRWNNIDITPSFVSATQLKATIDAAKLAAVGSASITVVNPGPGGGLSVNALSFTITAADQNPVPSLSALNPAGASAGDASFMLTVKGAGFINSSKIYWNGSERNTSFVSGTTLQAQISSADVAQPGAASISVITPGSGGGTSNALLFDIAAPGEEPPPSISQISPASTVAGNTSAEGLTVTILGANFAPDAQAEWDGVLRPTTYVNDQELHMALTGGDINDVGQHTIRVINPSPVESSSNSVSFSVGAAGSNPIPALLRATVMSMNTDGTVTLKLSGAGFVNGAQASWNGAARTVSFVSANELSMTITAADFLAGSGVIIVTNPGPGGGPSQELLMPVYRQMLPLVIAP